MRIIALIMITATIAAGCAPTPDVASPVATTTSLADTTTTIPETTTITVAATLPAVTTTTVAATTTTVVAASFRAALLRSVLSADGYGYMIDGVADSLIDDVGEQTCAVGRRSPTQAAFAASAVAAPVAAGTYAVDEMSELAVAALAVYCPDVFARLK